jgi:hypothetical protein
MRRDKIFLVLSTLFLAVVLLGFSRSFYLRSYFEFPELPIHLYVHGIVLTAWFALAATQPWLIASGRTHLHRKLGVLGAVIAVCVVITGVWTVTMRDAPVIDEFPMRAGGNIASLFMFSSCVALGIFFRRNSAIHKRLMLIASIPALAPALDRLARIPSLNDFFGRVFYWFPDVPEVAFALTSFLSLLLVVVAYDLITERRVHPGTLWGLFAIFVFSIAATFATVGSGAWAAYVRMVA